MLYLFLFFFCLEILSYLLIKFSYKYVKKKFLKNIINRFWIMQSNQLKLNPVNSSLNWTIRT